MSRSAICAGCGTDHTGATYLYDNIEDLTFRWGTLSVCSKQNGYGVKLSCKRKALESEAAQRCPVCGDPGDPRVPCGPCLQKMERLDKAEKVDSIPEVLVGIDFSALEWKMPHEFTNRDDRHRLTQTLARLVSTDGGSASIRAREGLSDYHSSYHKLITPGKSHTHGTYIGSGVLMREDRIEDLEWLGERLELVIKEAYKRGHSEGRDLLLGLASGDVSMKELNEKSVKASNS